MKTFDLIFVSLLLCVAYGTKLGKSNLKASQSQINDPAKFKTLKDCTNKSLSADFNFCCDLIVQDSINKQARVCVSLRSKNNLEPMATINGYPNSRCNYASYANVDGIERVWCKGSGNMDKVFMWPIANFIRVLNPADRERSLEVCQVGSNFSKCW